MPASGFAAIYAQKSNDELLRLAADKGSLTEEAQRALDAELAKRGVAAASTPPQAGTAAEVQPFSPVSTKLKNFVMVLGFFAALIGGWGLAHLVFDSSDSLGISKGTVAFLVLPLYLIVRWWFSRK